jgi:hypothetical protein
LERCPSLVSRNINQPSFSYKICRQSVKLLQLCQKLHTPTQLISPRLAEGQPEKPLVKGYLASQLTIL